MCRALDVDGDGFLGEADLQHWYCASLPLLLTDDDEAVSFEDLRQQLADALHSPQLPAAFSQKVRPCLGRLAGAGRYHRKLYRAV
jgi:hypothetical protein